MSRWRKSRRAPPLTLPTKARRRRRRVEPPRRLPPPWRRKREKPPRFLPKHPPSVSFSLSDIVYLSVLFLYLCICTFQKEATSSLTKTSKNLGASRNIKDMLHRDASPVIAPSTPAVKPSSAPTSSQAKE